MNSGGDIDDSREHPRCGDSSRIKAHLQPGTRVFYTGLLILLILDKATTARARKEKGDDATGGDDDDREDESSSEQAESRQSSVTSETWDGVT